MERPMREITLVGLLVIVMSVEAYGQTASAPLPVGSKVRFSPSPLDVAVSRQSVPVRPRRIHRCCNLKGALIGAGIGAAIGFAYATLCDAGDCTSTYIKYIAVMGGVGSGVGAFAGRQSPGLPLMPIPLVADRISTSFRETSDESSRLRVSDLIFLHRRSTGELSNEPLQPTSGAAAVR